MNRKIAIIIALQTLLIIVMFWVLVFYGKDEYEAYTREHDDEIESPSLISTELGATVVTLSAQSQALSDIQTTQLKASQHQTQLNAYGTVVSIEPLIDLRTRYLNARADAAIARASLTSSQQEYQRLAILNQDDHNISDHAVMVAEAAWKADQAKVAAAETTAGNLHDNIRQLWGDTLAMQATEQSASPALQRLLQYREVLVQITLPFDVSVPKTGDRLSISPVGTHVTIQAELVSPSPQADSTVQGKTYYYRAAADDLRAGMRLGVRMAESGKAVTGVLVPGSAVVWYGGKAWVYRKQSADKFTRLPINIDTEVDSGWFSSQLKPDDAIVTSGAQLLLSEEFKYQIKNENTD